VIWIILGAAPFVIAFLAGCICDEDFRWGFAVPLLGVVFIFMCVMSIFYGLDQISR